jgi:hypothetical protein
MCLLPMPYQAISFPLALAHLFKDSGQPPIFLLPCLLLTDF